MRLRPYVSLARTAFLRLMAYRMRYITGIATYAIFVGVHYFVWQAVYAAREANGQAPVGGLELEALITYLAVGYTARSAYYTNTDSEIASRFQSGEVVMDLIRPIDFHGNWLAQAAGEVAFRMCFFALPMAVVLVPLFGVQPPTGEGWWQFPLLFLVAFWINSELNLAAGTATFFLEDITGLMSLKRNLVMVASGLMVPLHFLQPLIGEVGVWMLVSTPLALVGYYPTLAYIGGIGAEGRPGMTTVVGLALTWIALLRLLNRWLWGCAKRRLEVQGG